VYNSRRMGKFTSQNKYEVSRQMGILNPEQILKSRQIGNSTRNRYLSPAILDILVPAILDILGPAILDIWFPLTREFNSEYIFKVPPYWEFYFGTDT
jgi:hypothetical protein